MLLFAIARPEIVGGLLGGSTIVPLAKFVDGKWVRAAPLDPKTASSYPRTWYAWTESLQRVPIRSGEVRRAEAHCAEVRGLSTTLQTLGHETTAFVTSSDRAKVFAGAGWDEPDLRRLALEELTRAGAALGEHEVSVRCVDLAADAQLCAFEAWSRERARDCGPVVFVRGWMSSGASTQVLTRDVTHTDCEEKMVRTADPELLLDLAGRKFVVVREHGYEDESFTILELTASAIRTLLKVPGTGC
jgi:hypothetical protein